MFGKEKKRFVVKEDQLISFGVISVVVDTHTGVNYLMTSGNGLNSMTPLLDSNGNIVIDKE
ncbi:MAG: DUF6440 family protein [Paraclostridium sp.]